ncbi:MAG: GNAT family N-acetyltransferase [Candidatus Zixiibacteriota bacterium]
MAFGLSQRFDNFIAELVGLLPSEFHGHYQQSIRAQLLKSYVEKPQGTFWKMKLIDDNKAHLVKGLDAKNVIRLNDSHLPELEKMYQLAYPDGFFNKRELKTGKYFGYLIDNKIVSCAGVHVDSEEHGVTALGSIATLPEFREKGYATIVTARLLKEIMDKREVIMLNVDSQNAAAVKCYSNLGFEKTHEYQEGFFTLKQ